MILKKEMTQASTEGEGWQSSLGKALAMTRQALFGGQLLGGIRIGDTQSLKRLDSISSLTESVRSIQVPADPIARLRFVSKWMARHQRRMAAGSMASMLVLPLLAQADEARVVLNELEGIREIVQRPDGHLQVLLLDGRELELAATDVEQVDGKWHVDTKAMQQAEAEALLALEAIDGIQHAVVNEDGSVTLIKTDGSRMLLEAESVQIVQGQAMTTQAELLEQGVLLAAELPSLLEGSGYSGTSTASASEGGTNSAMIWSGIGGAVGVAAAAGGSSSSSSSNSSTGSSSSSGSSPSPSSPPAAGPSDLNDSEGEDNVLVSPPDELTLEGFVIDGYISGARVFRDENGDGVWNPSEAYVFTDGNGFFASLAGDPTSSIAAVGGIDISTGQQFTGVLKAPAGATVVTPLTTLVQAQLEAKPELSIEQAVKLVANGMGLNEEQAASLLTVDPLAAAEAGVAESLDIVKAGMQVATLLQIASGGDTGVFAQLASKLAVNLGTGAVSFDNVESVQQLLIDQGVNATLAASAAKASEQIAQADSLELAHEIQKLSLNEVNGILPYVQDDSHELPSKPSFDTPQEWVGDGQGLTVTGSVESGDLVLLTLKDEQGNALTRSTEVVEDRFDITLAAELFEGLVNGAIHIEASAVFAGANPYVSKSSSITSTLDTVPPAEATIALVEDTGSVAGITRNGELEIAPAEAGATRQISVNGEPVADYEAPSEDGSYRIEVTDTDPAGNSTTNVFEFELDTAAPESPTLALANDTGSEAGVSSDTTLTVQAEPGSRVAIYQGDTLLGEAVESSEEPGQFSFTPDLADGDYAFTAVATDGAGNVSEASAELAVVLDTAAPEAPTLALANDTGSEAGVTSDTTLTLQAESGSRVAIYQGDTLLGEAVESSEEPGQFSFTPELADGDYAFTAVATDGAGNVSEASAELAVVLDTQVPDAPGLELVEDTGVSDSDGITNNGAVRVTSLEEGAAWEFSLDGGTTWLTGQGEGFLLEEGEYAEGQVQARQVDGAGNASGTGKLPAVTVDITPPDSLDLTLALAEDTGVSDSDGITANGQVDIQGLDSDAFWEYSLDGGANWKLGVGEHFIVTDGVYPEGAIQARQIDMAGNVGGETLLAQAVTILTQAPEAPLLQLAEDTGVSGSDGITSNGAVIVSGLVEGEAWEYSIDGGSTWLTGDTQDGQGTFVLSEGLYQEGTVLVRQADLAGNLSDSRSLG